MSDAGIFLGSFHPADRFTQVPKHWGRDPRMSWKAKGVMDYLAGHSPEYRLTIAQMIAESKDGKEAVYSALKELISLAYLKRKQPIDDKGRKLPVQYGWGPAAYEQQYERAWPPKRLDVSAGQTASGFSGSGEGSQVATGSGLSGTGEPATGTPGTGQPAPKEKKRKNTKEKNTSSPTPPAQPELSVPPAAPQEEAEEGAPRYEPQELADLVAEILDIAPPWDSKKIPQALLDPIVLRHPKPVVRRALLALAHGDHGHTWSPLRLLEPGPWWTAAERMERAELAQKAHQAQRERHLSSVPEIPTQNAAGTLRACGTTGCDSSTRPPAKGRIGKIKVGAREWSCPDCMPGTYRRELLAAQQDGHDVHTFDDLIELSQADAA